jgi:endo-1,4-beta-xylanase
MLPVTPDSNEKSEKDDHLSSLKSAFERAFLFGTALTRAHINMEDEKGAVLAKTHFNAITPENVMKWEEIHPGVDTFDFDAADRFVRFGEENDMFIVGHTLVWHGQTPQWVFEGDGGGLPACDILLKRMRDHIHTVVGRYKGRVHGWDVVNEALNDDGTFRDSPWYRVIGEEYIVKAFEYAREADPDAELYYNDYSLEYPEKRRAAVRLVKWLQERGVPITGIGTQSHFGLNYPDLGEFDKTLGAFARLGINVMITELEIDVLPASIEYQGADISICVELDERLNPYPNGLPESVQRQLADRYRSVFKILLNHRDVITRVTLWGVSDGDSWKNYWPARGSTNYPLLFDRGWRPKPAFFALLGLAQSELQ